jgi:hypothetical protein
MKATTSTVADQIFGRHLDLRAAVMAAIEPLPGFCYIEGKVGRIPQNDELVFMSQGRDPITFTAAEMKLETMPARIAEAWSKPLDPD